MKAALIGMGYWGPILLEHLRAAHTGPVVVCDQDPERLARVQARFPDVETTTRYEAILADPAVQCVLLATPIQTHGRLGLAALEAEKHLFVEKPLAASVDEAERLVRAAEAAGRVLMVGHVARYAPGVRAAKARIDAGELGEVLFVTATRVNLGRHRADASVIWDLAAHDLSILLDWLGEAPRRVQASGRDCVLPGVVDVAFLDLSFDSGVVASLEVSWLAPEKRRRVTVVGRNKMLVYDATGPLEALELHDRGARHDPGGPAPIYRAGEVLRPRFEPAEPLRTEIEHFLACARTGARPDTDGASGLRVVRILEAAERALMSGRPVALG